MTFNGISSDEFSDIRQSLIKDATQILQVCQSETGHLGDVIGCIVTTQQSIDIKVGKLNVIFEEQKANMK